MCGNGVDYNLRKPSSKELLPKIFFLTSEDANAYLARYSEIPIGLCRLCRGKIMKYYEFCKGLQSKLQNPPTTRTSEEGHLQRPSTPNTDGEGARNPSTDSSAVSAENTNTSTSTDVGATCLGENLDHHSNKVCSEILKSLQRHICLIVLLRMTHLMCCIILL